MKVKIGECGVDAGMLMVGDPCYFVGEEAIIHKHCKTWSQACDEVFCKQGVTLNSPLDVYGLGVAISTTYGDGCYPVFLETTKEGKRRLIVELE